MNGDTCVYIKPLNNKEVLFTIGNTPTVTFNNNVTVYTYPKVIYEKETVNETVNEPTMQSEPQVKMTFIKYIKKLLRGI